MIEDEHDMLLALPGGRMLMFTVDSLPAAVEGKGNKIINIPLRKRRGDDGLAHLYVLPPGTHDYPCREAANQTAPEEVTKRWSANAGAVAHDNARPAAYRSRERFTASRVSHGDSEGRVRGRRRPDKASKPPSGALPTLAG